MSCARSWIWSRPQPGRGADLADRPSHLYVLAPTVEMRNFREGDMVTVHGEVLREDRAMRSLGGALYRVHGIQMIQRR